MRGVNDVLLALEIVVLLLLVVMALVMAVKPATHALRIVDHQQVVIISVALMHPMTNVEFVVGIIVLVQIAQECRMVIIWKITVGHVIVIVQMIVCKIVWGRGVVVLK